MRDDTDATYERGEPEVVELGLDDEGYPQWYILTRNGWEDVGEGGMLTLRSEAYAIGTRIELAEPLPKQDR